MRRYRGPFVAMAVIALAATACSSSDGGSDASTDGSSPAAVDATVEPAGDGGGEGELVLGMLMAFSGPSVFEGEEAYNGCLPAEQVVNDAGGVLGQSVACQEFDTRGTSSDAVTATQQMLATTPNLFSVVGPSTAESIAAAPILEEAEQTMFSVAGDGRFDQSTNPFYYRLIPSDTVNAKAMSLYAEDRGFEDIALVFRSGESAEANVPPLLAGAEQLGIEVVENMTITAEQPSYRSEATQLVQADPDAIIFEADTVTAGTFLADLNQAGGGDIPLVTTVWAQNGDWQEAALNAYGGSEQLAEVLEPVIRYTEEGGEGYELFSSTLESLADQSGIDFETYSQSVYSRAHFDGVVIAALAATKADSVDAAVYNSHVRDIVDPGEGKTVVTTYADGLEALEAGEDIQYVGANGEILLNEYRNVTGRFATYRWDAESESMEFQEELDAEAIAEFQFETE